MSPCLKNRPIEMKRFVCGEPEVEYTAMPFPLGPPPLEDVTIRVTVALCWVPPPFPVTVIGYVPVGVLAPTVMVIVELPEPGAGIGFGLKLTVVPDGAPNADRLIALLKPPLTVVVIVDVP